MTEKILILDFGSQYTQLIARAVREANVYCEIVPFHKNFEYEPGLKGIILSGSPYSVNDPNAPDVNVQFMISRVPVLGVCYGAQLTAKQFGGRVENSNKREYGRALLHKRMEDIILKDVMELWEVRGVFSTKLSAPGEVETRLAQLETAFQQLNQRLKNLEK